MAKAANQVSHEARLGVGLNAPVRESMEHGMEWPVIVGVVHAKTLPSGSPAAPEAELREITALMPAANLFGYAIRSQR